MESREEDLRYGVLDSACWARTGVTGPTIAEEINDVLIKKGLTPFIASSKGRLEGANAFKQRLIGNEIEEGNYKPAIKFFSTCIHCLRTIPMIGHDKHKPELPDTDAEDHCFVAGTLIHTLRGEIPIEEVTTADKVLTRRGYRKVLASGLTKRNAKIVTVTFSNGKSLTGTGNHPIFTKDKGFVPLDTVKYGDIIYHVSEVENLCQGNKQKQQNRSYLTALRSGDTLTQKNKQTNVISVLTGVFANKVFLTYIEKCGNPTTAKSPKGIMFITKTGIFSTMIFLILSYSLCTSIWFNTCKKGLRMLEILKKLNDMQNQYEKRQLNGTALKRGENGTVNTGSNVPSVKLPSQKLNVSVSSAEKNFTRQATDVTIANIAQTPAVQSTGATMGLMTKLESALCVARNLELIDTEGQKPVAKNAGLSVVVKHEEKRRADVYNLTVDEEHEYFANGFLVHNCYDAVAYACLSRPWVPVRKNRSSAKHDAWAVEEKKPSVWTL